MSSEYRTQIAGRELAPESLMMGYGYRPEWSEGALKSPIFQTSTFTFRTAAEGKRWFELAYGLDEPREGEQQGLIYSRLNNPDLEILEQRLTLWDGAEAGLAFASGMAAITTTLLTLVEPGTVVVHSTPVYGGTDHFLNHTLPRLGVEPIPWRPGVDIDSLDGRVGDRRVAAVLIETPANPTNDLFSIREARTFADRHAERHPAGEPVPVAVDNTFLGPLWQHPLAHGADIVLYSATKFIGGHSDLIAGAALGRRAMMGPVGEMRTILGTMAAPQTGWLILRSLETLAIRMRRQAENAAAVAAFLAGHAAIEHVSWLGQLEEGTAAADLYREQCAGPGSMISFRLRTDEAGAFRFLDALELIHLAVSLGSTESLIEHPATMTHAGCDPATKQELGVDGSLVRLSVGVEHPEDLIADLANALDKI